MQKKKKENSKVLERETGEKRKNNAYKMHKNMQVRKHKNIYLHREKTVPLRHHGNHKKNIFFKSNL